MFSLPLAGGFAGAAMADEAAMLEALRNASPEEAPRLERQLRDHWSKSGSASMDFLLKRGRDAIETQQWRRAIEHLSALTDHAPDFAEGFHSRAIAYYNTQRYGPALADLEQVLALNPNHFGALMGLATIFESLGDAQRAYDAYGMVLDLHPHAEDAQEGRERTLREALGREL